MPSQNLVEELKQAIREELSSNYSNASEELAGLLAQIIDGSISADQFRSIINSKPEVKQEAVKLSGRQIGISKNVISFGDDSQTGDVKIGDVAGRDIVTINFNIGNLHYPPSSLQSTLARLSIVINANTNVYEVRKEREILLFYKRIFGGTGAYGISINLYSLDNQTNLHFSYSGQVEIYYSGTSSGGTYYSGTVGYCMAFKNANALLNGIYAQIDGESWDIINKPQGSRHIFLLERLGIKLSNTDEIHKDDEDLLVFKGFETHNPGQYNNIKSFSNWIGQSSFTFRDDIVQKYEH